MTIKLTGISGAGGLADGEAFVLEHEVVPRPRMLVAHGLQIPEEVARLRWAMHSASQEVAEIRRRLSSDLGEEALAILDAHVEMLSDEWLRERAVAEIRERGFTAEWAFGRALQGLRERLSTSADKHFRSRVEDVEAVEQRVLRRLRDKAQSGLLDVPEGCVLVTRDLSAADAAQVTKSGIRALVTELGGRTSHTAVIARAAGIPAVVGIADLVEVLSTGDELLVDGGRGEVVVRPSAADRQEHAARLREQQVAERSALARTRLPATTAEGFPIAIRANIQSASCVDLAIDKGARGVGLMRTEFLFLSRQTLPEEEEQYAAYRAVAEGVAPASVTIRTLDLGGDKMPASMHFGKEPNRALGLRGVRFSLKHRDLFMTQLRAILRASAHGKVRVALPMVSGLAEVTQSLAAIHEARKQLRAKGMEVAEDVPVGVMVEVPSAALIADGLAEVVSFISIGTNDLIQYSLAIDRANEQVAYLYDPLHPAVLRMIMGVVRAGDGAGIPVALCGEMAGDPRCIPVLLGLGLRELSMNALAIPGAKEAIRSTPLRQARQLVGELLTLDSSEEIHARLAAADWYAERWPVSGQIPEEPAGVAEGQRGMSS